jgi:hypothetical protein
MDDHLVPEIILTDLQQLDLHFVLGRAHLFVRVRQERRDLQVCVHQWARGLHPNLVTVPHPLHVQAELVVADTHLQLVHLLEAVLRQFINQSRCLTMSMEEKKTNEVIIQTV